MILLFSLLLAHSPFCEEPLAPWGVDADFTKPEKVVVETKKRRPKNMQRLHLLFSKCDFTHRWTKK